MRLRPAVNRFARDRANEVEYFLYLQWLAEEQLCEAQTAARDHGMSIGLYGDVAVGANPGGSETWSNRHLYLAMPPLARRRMHWRSRVRIGAFRRRILPSFMRSSTSPSAS